MNQSNTPVSSAYLVVPDVNILTITPPRKGEVIRIASDGRLFWHGREVETDADFRDSMIDLAKHLFPQRAPQSEIGTPTAWIWHYTDGRKSLRWRPDHDPSSSDVPDRVTPLYLNAAQPAPLDRNAVLAGVSDLAGLIGALGEQKQCDPDGVECQVSRQAVEEALSVLRALKRTAPQGPEKGSPMRSRDMPPAVAARSEETRTPVAWFRLEGGIRVYYETEAWPNMTPLYSSAPSEQSSSDKPGRLQRYTFENLGAGWQFTTTTDGLWVMAKDADDLERELAECKADLARAIANHAADLSAQPATAPLGADGRRAGKYSLVYNKTTKKIDKVSNVDGLVAESFDPPQECGPVDDGNHE